MSNATGDIVRTHVIDGHRPGPHLLVVAGVHGDEFEPMAAVYRLCSEISPEGLWGKITLVPIANQSAYVLGKRTGDDGLDLARVCPGDANGTVTLRAGHAISELIRSADALVDLHTGGHILTVFPIAGYVLHENPSVLDTQRRMARAFNLPLVWGTSPLLNGRTLSVARDANIPAIYVEHGGGSYVASRVDELVTGCFNVLRELNMLDVQKPVDSVKFIIEEPREQSGNLQANYPAPISGLFHPSVKLGTLVSAGEEIGFIVDLLNDERRSIVAVESGVLIMLRAWNRVNVGDTLAAIARTAVTS